MRVSRVEEMRAMDATAIEKYGIADELLMENAGHASYEIIRRKIGLFPHKFLIVSGSGNNGGDGLVVARKLFSNGADVHILLAGNPEKFKGSAKLNYEIVRKIGIPLTLLETAQQAAPFIEACDVVVDAIFGTGLARQVEGKYRELIQLINQANKTVVSIDIPSGINGNSGQVMGVAVRAHYTITFGLAKWGNLLYPGFEHGGELFVTHISFPPDIYENEAVKVMLNMLVPLPPRAGNMHKGSAGKVLFVAGAANYLGAPYFAAQAFLRVGGGLSYLATPHEVAPFIANKGSEIVLQPMDGTAQGSLALANEEKILALSEEMLMLVMGSGTSLNSETQTLIRNLAQKSNKPVLIDGDGITAIAEDLACIKERSQPTILTPHPGEMARLSGYSIREIEENRIEILQEVSHKLNAIIVLKGAHSLIGLPDGRVFINLSGNSGMATAGSGDVLTGTIAAMFARYRDAEVATRMGVFVHGLAGDLAAATIGQDGLVAGDILGHLPQAVIRFREEWQEMNRNFYGKISII